MKFGNLQTFDIVILMATGAIFFSFLAGFIIYFMFLYRQKQLLHIEEEKRLKAEYDQALAESQYEIQEDVLRHVSSEIHDNLGQIASLLKIHLHTLPVAESGVGKLNESKELLSQLIHDLKALSISLNTNYIYENGWVHALENEILRINKTGTIQAFFASQEERITIDHTKEIFLFRMAQEILNNMLKHSKATEIQVNIKKENNLLAASFHDNGCGFNVAEMLDNGIKNKHSGLRSLQKRGQLIEAEIKIESKPGQGSEFIIILPL
jgi:two-component system NarL family sensor kinase